MSEAAWEALAMDALGELGWEPLEGKRVAPSGGLSIKSVAQREERPRSSMKGSEILFVRHADWQG